MPRSFLTAFSYFLVIGCLSVSVRGNEVTPAFRRPVAILLAEDAKFAITANQRSGSLTVVDLEKIALVSETKVAKQISDMVSTVDRRHLLVTDESSHELLLISTSPTYSHFQVKQRLKVSPYPVSVVVSKDGQHCYVASLWSRRLTAIALPKNGIGEARIEQVWDLEIAPRKQLLVENDRRLLVADSFGGKLADVDLESRKVLGIREFPGHNIRGLGLSENGKMLLVAHQMLNDYAHTTRNDVHWGLLMSNDLRWLRLDRVLAGAKDLYEGGHMHPLGHAGNAMGDPTGLAVTRDGMVVVTIGGTQEIAFGKEGDFSMQRLNAGKRPMAIAVSADGKRAYVANHFGDSISVLDLENREPLHEISLGATPQPTQIDLGEQLFYDARLSHDGWMSCHSCHTDGHTNGQMNDNFSDESFGAPKRVLTLLGRTDTAPFAWNGAAKTLEDQIRKSISNTMQGDTTPSKEEIAALVSYIGTLTSPPSVDVLRGTSDTAAIARGQTLFHEQNCVRCHAPPTYTTPKTYDVGLKDKQGNDHFNPPSLRGVGQRAPYLHDNRAATLVDVFREHDHPLKRSVSDAELSDLVTFLRSL